MFGCGQCFDSEDLGLLVVVGGMWCVVGLVALWFGVCARCLVSRVLGACNVVLICEFGLGCCWWGHIGYCVFGLLLWGGVF